LTVAEIIEEIRVLRPRSFAAVTAGQASIAAERPHQNAANWYYRPTAAVCQAASNSCFVL
jgi:hypothetical protein